MTKQMRSCTCDSRSKIHSKHAHTCLYYLIDQKSLAETSKPSMVQEFANLQEKSYEIMKAKNADYSGNEKSPFSNFDQIELISKGEITREQGCLVRMTDKLSRVYRLLNHEAAVSDEKIEDTLIDLANYSLLLILMRRERDNERNQGNSKI